MPEFGDRTGTALAAARSAAAKRLLEHSGGPRWAPPVTWYNAAKGALPTLAAWLPTAEELAQARGGFTDLEAEAYGVANQLEAARRAERQAQIERQRQAQLEAFEVAKANAVGQSGSETVLRGIGNMVGTIGKLGAAMVDIPPQTQEQARAMGAQVAEAASFPGQFAQYEQIARSPVQSFQAQPLETTFAVGAPLATAMRAIRGARAVRAGEAVGDVAPAAVPDLQPGTVRTRPPATPTAEAIAAAAPNTTLETPRFDRAMGKVGTVLRTVGKDLSPFDVSAPGAMTGAILGAAAGQPAIGAAIGAALPLAGKLVGNVSPVLGRAIGRGAASLRRAGHDYRAQPEPAVEAVVQNIVTEPVRIGRELQGSGQQVSRVMGKYGMDLDPEVQFPTPAVMAGKLDSLGPEQAKAAGLERLGETVEMLEPAESTAAAAQHAGKAVDLQADLVASSDMLEQLREIRKAFADEAKQATLGQSRRVEEAAAELRRTTDPEKRKVLVAELRDARKQVTLANPTVSDEYKRAVADLDAAEANLRRAVNVAKNEREAAIGAGKSAQERLAKVKADRDALFEAAKQARAAHQQATAAFEFAVSQRRAAVDAAAKNMKGAAGYQEFAKPDKDVVSDRIKARIGEEAKAEQLARDTAWAEARSKQLGDLRKLKVELLKDEYREAVRKWSADALRGKAVGNKAEYWKRERPAAEARVSQRIQALQAEREAAYAKAKQASEAYRAKANEVYKKAKADDPDIAEYAAAKKAMDEAVAAYKAAKDKTAVEGALENLRGAYGQKRLQESRAKGAAQSVRNLADTMKAEREARWSKVKQAADEREVAFGEKRAAAEVEGQTQRLRDDVAEVDQAAAVAREGVKGAREAFAKIGEDLPAANKASGVDVEVLPAGERAVMPTHPALRKYVEDVTRYSNMHNAEPFAVQEIAREFSSLATLDTPGIFRDPKLRSAVANRLLAKKFGIAENKLGGTLPDGSNYREAATKLNEKLYELAESQMTATPRSLIFAGADALETAREIFFKEFDGAKRNQSLRQAAEQYGKMLANKVQESVQARTLYNELWRARPPLGDAGKDVLPANSVAYAAAKELAGDTPHTALWAPIDEIRGKLANPQELVPLVRKWAEMAGQQVDDAQILAQLKKMSERWDNGVAVTAQHPVAEFLNKASAFKTVDTRVDQPLTLLPGAESAYKTRITTAEAASNIHRISDAASNWLANITRSGKFGLTSGNPASYVNNIGGNMGQNLTVRGLDPLTWANNLRVASGQYGRWLNAAGSADEMRKWNAINETGVVRAPAFDTMGRTVGSGFKRATLAKSAEKAHEFVTSVADEAYQTFGDRAFKVEAASTIYDDLLASAKEMMPGRVQDWDIGDGRRVRIKMTSDGGWSVNGRSATLDDVAKYAAKAGAALAQDMFVDVERTGLLTQAIRRSSVASIASPFVTWMNRARPTPWQRGFLGDSLGGSPSPIVWTNDPSVVESMVAKGLKTAAVRSLLSALAKQEAQTPSDLIDAYSWGDGPGAIGVWRDDEGRLSVKNFDTGSAFAPTATLFRLGTGAAAIMDSVVASAPQDLFLRKDKDGELEPIDRDTLTQEQRAQRRRWVRMNSRANVSEKTVLGFLNLAGGPISTMWADVVSGKGVDPTKVGLTIAGMFTGAIPPALYDIGTTQTRPGSEMRKRYLGDPDDDRQEAESIVRYSVRRMLSIGIKPDVPENTISTVLDNRVRVLRKSMNLMTKDQYDKAYARAEDNENPQQAYWAKVVEEQNAKQMMFKEAADDIKADIRQLQLRMEAARKVKGKQGWIRMSDPVAEDL